MLTKKLISLSNTPIQNKTSRIPKKYHPPGFEILYEDQDIIVGNKKEGILTVAAHYDRAHNVFHNLNQYVRKGNSRSKKCVFVVHRLDRETSGVLIFAKTAEAKNFLKSHWKSFTKTYFAVVYGKLKNKEGLISSYLSEDEDYVVSSSNNQEEGELAQTAYKVIDENSSFSLLKINLITGKKNQIRVHLADLGHPIVGDTKYGNKNDKHPRLALHAFSLIFKHPFSRKELTIESPFPEYFRRLISSH